MNIVVREDAHRLAARNNGTIETFGGQAGKSFT